MNPIVRLTQMRGRIFLLLIALLIVIGTLLWRTTTPRINTLDNATSPPTTMVSADQQQVLTIAQATAAKRGFDIDDMSFVFISDQFRHPHIRAQNVLTWGSVTEEEQQTNWLVYGFPVESGQRGGDILVLVDKDSGTVARVIQGR